jgi:glycosyltransferase involved in cell wall biosynthesis
MKVGIDCRLPYYQMGGISQYILHLLPALAALDGDNHYQIFHSRKDSKSYLPEAALNFSRLDLFTPCHHKYERWSLGAELLLRDVDVFHSPDFIPPAYGVGKRVVTIHDLNFMHYPEFLTSESRRYYLDQIEWAVGEADHIIADSDHTRKDLENVLGVSGSKLSTIYLAANPLYKEKRTTEQVAQVLDRYELSKNFILFVGTISPRKNVHLLLAAYEKLLNSNELAEPLVLVGRRGWLSDDVFDEIDRLRSSLDVRHLENVSDYELSCLYAAAGVLTLPSFYEGFGLPAVEAMHCGCPVISSDRGSLPEVVGDAGILLDPEDLQGWIDSIKLVLSEDVVRDESRKKGFAQASTFNWDQTAAKTLGIYQTLSGQ